MSAQALANQIRDLADLLDKLIAVDLELEPFSKAAGDPTQQRVAASAAIGQTCDVLRSSIADLRSIILEIEGMPYLPSRKPGGRRAA
jgi:hypothetical protein